MKAFIEIPHHLGQRQQRQRPADCARAFHDPAGTVLEPRVQRPGSRGERRLDPTAARSTSRPWTAPGGNRDLGHAEPGHRDGDGSVVRGLHRLGTLALVGHDDADGAGAGGGSAATARG